MQRSEAAALISRIVAFDRREADGLTVDAWFDIIGHLDYQPAYQAVLSHYRAPGAYPIRPGEVIERVAQRRRDEHRQALADLATRHHAELMQWLGAEGAEAQQRWGSQPVPLGILGSMMFEVAGEPADVEAARNVVRRQTQERKALEAQQGDDIASLQLEPAKPTIPVHEEWMHR